MCGDWQREMKCNDPPKQRYCFYFAYTVSTVVLRDGFPRPPGDLSVCKSLRRVRPNFNYPFACSIVICRSALQNLERAQISSFCMCIFLMVSDGSHRTNSKFFGFCSAQSLRTGSRIPLEWPLFPSFSALEFTLYDITETRILMTACTPNLASCVFTFSFTMPLTTAEDIYHVPGSNFFPDAGCLNLGFAWVSSVLPANSGI
jgi:hypothetical protein